MSPHHVVSLNAPGDSLRLPPVWTILDTAAYLFGQCLLEAVLVENFGLDPSEGAGAAGFLKRLLAIEVRGTMTASPATGFADGAEGITLDFNPTSTTAVLRCSRCCSPAPLT